MPTSKSTSHTLAYVAGGLGVVGLGASGFFWASAKSKHATALDAFQAGDYDGATSTDAGAHDAAKASLAAGLVGGALVATGVVLYVTSPGGGTTAFAPTLGPSHAGVSVTRGF